MFHSEQGSDDEAGGGGNEGLSLDEVIGIGANSAIFALVERNKCNNTCGKQREAQEHMKFSRVVDVFDCRSRHRRGGVICAQLDFFFTGGCDRAGYLTFIVQRDCRRGGAVHQKHRYGNEAQLHRAKYAPERRGTRQKSVPALKKEFSERKSLF